MNAIVRSASQVHFDLQRKPASALAESTIHSSLSIATASLRSFEYAEESIINFLKQYQEGNDVTKSALEFWQDFMRFKDAYTIFMIFGILHLILFPLVGIACFFSRSVYIRFFGNYDQTEKEAESNRRHVLSGIVICGTAAVLVGANITYLLNSAYDKPINAAPDIMMAVSHNLSKYIGHVENELKEYKVELDEMDQNFRNRLSGNGENRAKRHLDVSPCHSDEMCRNVSILTRNAVSNSTIFLQLSSLQKRIVQSRKDLKKNSLTSSVSAKSNLQQGNLEGDIKQIEKNWNEVKSKVLEKLAEVSDSGLKKIKLSIASNESKSYFLNTISSYQLFRNRVASIVVGTAFITSILYWLGIIMGSTNYHTLPTLRSQMSNRGGNIVLCSALGSLFMTWVILALLLFAYSIGSFAERYICQNVDEPYVAFKFYVKVRFVQDHHSSVTFEDLLRNCRKNHPLYQALGLYPSSLYRLKVEKFPKKSGKNSNNRASRQLRQIRSAPDFHRFLTSSVAQEKQFPLRLALQEAAVQNGSTGNNGSTSNLEDIAEDMSKFLDDFIDKVTMKLGRCKPLYEAYVTMTTLTCDWMVDILNGSWLAWLVAINFLFETAFVAVRLSVFYRKNVLRKAHLSMNRPAGPSIESDNLLIHGFPVSKESISVASVMKERLSRIEEARERYTESPETTHTNQAVPTPELPPHYESKSLRGEMSPPHAAEEVMAPEHEIVRYDDETQISSENSIYED